jgi:hypothetical protein
LYVSSLRLNAHTTVNIRDFPLIITLRASASKAAWLITVSSAIVSLRPNLCGAETRRERQILPEPWRRMLVLLGKECCHGETA